MIRIRPGRNWRQNPAYLGELRALTGPRARGFTGADILDVVGIEVDGVDIAAGVGEGRVLVAVDELAQALLRLGDGEPAAQATIASGPTELLLEARGPDLLLTLISLAPPARVVASGLLVDARAMRTAVLHAARGLSLDLLSISPALEDAPLLQRLGTAAGELSRRDAKGPRRWPARAAEAKTVMLSQTRKAPGESLRLELPPQTMARLRGGSAVRSAPLAPHLGEGSLALVRKGAPGLQCEGPIFLILRNLLGDAGALVEAWETGEREFVLHFGSHELRWDLTADSVRAPGWRRPLTLSPLRLAGLLGLAARAYADEALQSNRADELAADLRERALALDRHCQDLASGDLRRAPATISSPAALPLPPGQAGPLGPGKMRRLIYREAFRVPAPGALRLLPLPQGPCVVELPDALAALDEDQGEALWKVPAAPGAAARGAEVFYAEPGESVVRLDAVTGEVRWKRRLRGAGPSGPLWAAPGGVARALEDEGLAFINDSGSQTFRVRLPGGAPRHLAFAPEAIVAALRAGMVAGLDPADGRILWKRRLRLRELLACGSRVLALSRGALACLDPATGKTSWEAEAPEDATGLTVADASAHLIGGGAVRSYSLADGAARGAVELPWARHLLAEEDGLLLATGAGGAAARLDGKRWTLPGAGDAPAEPALLQRGAVLLRGSATSVHNAPDGLPLATLPRSRDAVLWPDLSCALLLEDEVAVHRMSMHLSLL